MESGIFAVPTTVSQLQTEMQFSIHYWLNLQKGQLQLTFWGVKIHMQIFDCLSASNNMLFKGQLYYVYFTADDSIKEFKVLPEP